MKTAILTLCACLLWTASAALGQQAQPQHDPIAENLFPPELIMQNQQAIGLEDAQKSFIRAEITKAQSHFSELQWQLQDAMESMASLLKSKLVDEQQVLAQLDKVLNIEREIKRTQIGLMVRIKNKLTPEQQAHLRELHARAGS